MSGPPALGRFQRSVLTMLGEAGDRGLEARDMVSLATPARPLQQRQSEVSEALRRLRDHGLASRSERQRSQGAPYRWYITAEGRAAAARPAASEAAAASKARNETRRRAAGQALEAARALGFGPGIPLGERRAMSATLRAAGCTLQQIGDLFGVTRETIRKSLAPAGDP